MTAPTTTLLADLSGAAFGSANPTTDLSAYLERGDGGQPVVIQWGRSDGQDGVQPARFSFVLDNSDGRFTTGASIITTASFFKVRLTYNATDYNRVAGYVDDVEVLWPGGATGYCVIRVSCSDISARLGEAQPLRSMFDEEVLADNPIYFYPLQEGSSSNSAGDLMQVAPPLRLTNSKYGSSTLAFGSDGSTFDRMGVQFDSDNYGTATTGPLSVLSVRPGTGGPGIVPTSGGFTFEVVTGPLTAPAGSGYSVLAGQFSDDTNVLVKLELFDLAGTGTGTVFFVIGDAPGSQSYSGGPIICDGQPHHLVGTVAADNKTVDMWVDGVEYTADHTNASALALGRIANILIGGQLMVNGDSKNGLRGVIAAHAMYAGVLSPSRIQAHAAAALGTGPSERSDQRFTRLLGYAGLTTSGLPTGQATMAGQRTAGKTVGEALKQVADTEGSPFFVKPNGDLTFQARNTRYWPSARDEFPAYFTEVFGILGSFSLDGTDVDGDRITARKDRLGLVNDQTATRDGGAAQRAEDATSRGDFGRRDGGDVQVACATDFDALQNAAWRVASGKDPQLRLSSVPVDLLTQPTASLVQSVLSASISTALTVSGLPSQTPGGSSMTLFLEGASESIGVDSWGMELFTSPTSAIPGTLRADATATGKTKLDSGLVIPF